MTAVRTMFRLAIAAALLTAPAVGVAQGPVSTGTTPPGSVDPFWQVSVNGGALAQAFVLGRGPGWIGASASGSLPGGAADGAFNRFMYSFQTTFTGGTVAGATYLCARDDTFFSVVLNGALVPGAGCPGYDFASSFTLSGFNAGLNTLQFNTGGNGVTDGLVVSFTALDRPVTTVPEPGSLALLATGLIGITVAIRRRRSA